LYQRGNNELLQTEHRQENALKKIHRIPQIDQRQSSKSAIAALCKSFGLKPKKASK